jgi:hypothetical protein
VLRVLSAVIAVVGAWTIVSSLVFRATTVVWLVSARRLLLRLWRH